MKSLLADLLADERSLHPLRTSPSIAVDLEESIALFASRDLLEALAAISVQGFLPKLRALCRARGWLARVEAELEPDAFLSKRLENWFLTSRLLLDDFEVWKEELRESFGVSGPIRYMVELDGDPHGLQGVFRVGLTNGRSLVYRRRPFGTDLLWHEAVRVMNRLPSGTVRLSTSRPVGDDRVSWQRFYERIDSPSLDRQLVEQWGLLLALAQVCRLNDAHRDNFLVAADGPVLVDTETMLFREPLVTGVDALARSLETSLALSILGTGMLPRPRRTTRGWQDYSALSPHSAGRQSIIRRPVVELSGPPWVKWGSKTIRRMRLAALSDRREGESLAGAVDILVTAYESGIQHAAEVAAALDDQKGCTLRRRVLRPTYQYREELLQRRLVLRLGSAASHGVLERSPSETPAFLDEEERQLSLWQVPLLRELAGSADSGCAVLAARSAIQIRASLLGVSGGRLRKVAESPLQTLTRIVGQATCARDCYVYDATPAGKHFLTYPTGLSLTSGLAGVLLTLDRFDPSAACAWRGRARGWLASQCEEVVSTPGRLPMARLVPGGPIHGLLYLARTTLPPSYLATLVERVRDDCLSNVDTPAGSAIRFTLWASLGVFSQRPSDQDIEELLGQGLHYAVGYWLLDAIIADGGDTSKAGCRRLVERLVRDEQADAGCAVPLAALRTGGIERAQGQTPPMESRLSGLDGLAGAVWLESGVAPSVAEGGRLT